MLIHTFNQQVRVTAAGVPGAWALGPWPGMNFTLAACWVGHPGKSVFPFKALLQFPHL